uniref:RRM domain-containing protein n=1 Tax=Anopheles maculatus TaxID=74869 RepID=A0A182T3Z2_9DIPT
TGGGGTSLINCHSDDNRPLAICVRNLPARSSDTSLKDGLFHEYKKHGKVTWVKVVGQNTDRYALVCFKKPEDVDKALEVSHDKLFFGCKIEVAPYAGYYDVDDNEFRPYEAELDEYHPKSTRTLFVGNLEKDITGSELRKHFECFGEIIEIDIKKQGVSAYAFCQYSDIVSVVKAIRKMDGEHLGNNRIKLGFGKSMPTNCVWLDGVSDSASENYLAAQFNHFGTVSQVSVDRDRKLALIYYEQVQQAQAAVKEMRGVMLRGRKLQVDFASRECQEAFFDKLDKQQSGGSISSSFGSPRFGGVTGIAGGASNNSSVSGNVSNSNSTGGTNSASVNSSGNSGSNSNSNIPIRNRSGASFSRPGNPLSGRGGSDTGSAVNAGIVGGSASPRVDPLSLASSSSTSVAASSAAAGGGIGNVSSRGGNSGSVGGGVGGSTRSRNVRYSSEDYYSEGGGGGGSGDRRFRSYDEYSQGSATSSTHEDERYDHHEHNNGNSGNNAGTTGSSAHVGSSTGGYSRSSSLIDRLSGAHHHHHHHNSSSSDSPPSSSTPLPGGSAMGAGGGSSCLSSSIQSRLGGDVDLSPSSTGSSIRKRSEKGTGGDSSNMRYLQKERVHILEQLEECPSSGDELVSPKKRIKYNSDGHHHHHHHHHHHGSDSDRDRDHRDHRVGGGGGGAGSHSRRPSTESTSLHQRHGSSSSSSG